MDFALVDVGLLPGMFVFISCHQCGRTLRAVRSPEKSMVRCWDCGAEVTVPRFRSTASAQAERSLEQAETSVIAEGLAMALVLTVITTSALVIPRFGWMLGLGVLSVGGVMYLRRIEEENEVEEEQDEVAPAAKEEKQRPPLAERLKRWALRIGAGTVLAVGLCLPFLLGDGSRQFAYAKLPLEGPIHYVVAALLWLGLPLLAILFFGRDLGGERLGLSGFGSLVRGRPWSVLGAVALFPLALVVIEGLLLLGLWLAGWLPIFVYDLFPLSEGMRLEEQILMVGDSYYIPKPNDDLAFYLEGLGRGDSLTGSIPQSIRRGLSPRLSPVRFTDLSREGYLLSRLLLTLAILAVALCALALQAEWLANLSRSVPTRGSNEEA